MTVSLAVREPVTIDGEHHYRFGLAVTTRLPGVGALCPFVSEDGALVVQSHVSQRLGERGLSYLADGLAIDDALGALLAAEGPTERRNRQVHGVDREKRFTFTGSGCVDVAGHRVGKNYTVAGNLLTDDAVLDAIATAYESSAFGEQPLAERLIDALAAGQEVGGDKRESLTIQSAALKVVSTEPTPFRRFFNDLRVDASETPIADLRTTYEAATLGYELSRDAYGSTDEPREFDGS